MKKLLVVLTGILFTCCSSPKYTYYFDRYTAQRESSLTKELLEADVNDTFIQKNSIHAPEETISNSLVPIPRNVIAENTLEEIPVKSVKMIVMIDDDPKLSPPKITRKDIVKALKEFKAKKRSEHKSDGDKKKNGFAIAGFITSIAGLIFLVAIFGAVVQTLPLVLIGVGITGIGAILSRIGRKSERRVIARIGFWIGLGVIALGLVVGAFALLLKALGADI